MVSRISTVLMHSPCGVPRFGASKTPGFSSISKPKFGKNATISKPKTPGFSSISKPKFGKNVTISKPKHPVFHPFPNQNSGKTQSFPNQNTRFFIHFQTKIREKRDHFQTKTPHFSSISKPKIEKSATISKPKHTYYSFGFRRARIESSCKANAIKLACIAEPQPMMSIKGQNQQTLPLMGATRPASGKYAAII